MKGLWGGYRRDEGLKMVTVFERSEPLLPNEVLRVEVDARAHASH